MHSIRVASSEDVDSIREFIAAHWRNDHIFVRSESFFEYEMCNGDVCNFAIAFDSNELIGILGFVPSDKVIEDSELFLVMFRVLKGQSAKVGIDLVRYVMGLTRKGVHTLGADPKVLGYYRFLGFKTGWMDHYCWVNASFDPARSKFIKDDSCDAPVEDSGGISPTGWWDVEASSTDAISFLAAVGEARSSRFLKRYSLHPLYNYRFLMSDEGALGVYRLVTVDGMTCVRVIDWSGPFTLFPAFIYLLRTKAIAKRFGYIDCYSTGLPESIATAAGLARVDNERFLVPNYLNPIVWENTSLSYVTTADELPFFMRGDGDQDRPS